MTAKEKEQGMFSWKKENLKGARKVFETQISAEQAKSAEKEALSLIGAKKKVKGFRPGSIPENILRENTTREELADMTVRVLAPALLRDIQNGNDVKPILQPRIDLTKLDPLTVRITIVEEPEVKIGALDKKLFAKSDHKVDDKDVERVVSQFLKEHIAKTPTEDAAKEGDIVIADFYAHDETGKEIDNTRFDGYEIEIGSKTLIPGFEDGLIGMKKGETREVKLVFPEKYHAEHLRNKPATFFVTAKDVLTVKKAELTGAFIKEKLGAEKTPDDFRDEIRKSLIAQEESMDSRRRENGFFEAVAAATKTELAPELVFEEAGMILDEFSSRLGQQGLTIADWLRSSGKSEADLRKEVEEQANKRLTVQWGLRALVEKEKIETTEEEIKKAHEGHNHEHVDPAHDRHVAWELKVKKLMEKYLNE